MMRMKFLLSSSSAFILSCLLPNHIIYGQSSDFVIGETLQTLSDLVPYYDENGKLGTHLFLYPESCSDEINKLLLDDLRHENSAVDPHYGRKFHPISGDLEKEYFNNNNNNNKCNAVCVERGVDQSLVQYPMPHLYYMNDENENASMSNWYYDYCQSVMFGFINYHSKSTPIAVYWINPNGKRIFNRDLHWGERKTQFISTFLGHTFEFEDPTTKTILLSHTVEFEGIRTIGQYATSEHDKEKKAKNIDKLVKSALETEWGKHNRVKRSFTSLGFAKGRLPNDIFASMGSYYYNNAQYICLEEWGGKGVFVNWWEVDAKFIQISWHLKRVWQGRLLKLVEEWSGTELEQTDMYGIRQYEPGARLLTHVDRVNTHAASLIINIAQGNVTEPWRVEVHDHADRLHEVVMQPGDIVYYESAKCLHGRNTPLKGGYYANIFTHYRPKGDPDWYTKPNPKGTPKPLLDVGDCQLVGPNNAYSQGSVQCDNQQIGPHLSPSGFIAGSGSDLYSYWKKVAPPPKEQETIMDEEL